MIKFRSLIHSAVGSKFKRLFVGFLLACMVVLNSPVFLFAKTPPIDLRSQIESVFTRHAQYLDTQWKIAGWQYAVPSRHYREIGRNSSQNIRMQATFASFYLFTQSKESNEKIRTAMLDVLYYHPELRISSVARAGQRISTRSFHDAIGLYLALDILWSRSQVFSTEEYQTMLTNIREMYPWVLRAPDMENRALLGAAYGAAILSHPLVGFSREQHVEYELLIRKKIEVGLRSIDKNFVYREGRGKQFSAHYHLVSTAMLYVLADRFHDEHLRKIAKGMTVYFRKRYPIGALTWRGSHRPTGVGLQTVLLRAFCEKMSGNPKWMKYWEREKKGRGFIEKINPNRLIWRDEVDKTMNDDYSFGSMGILLYGYL